ncbi:MAG: YecA family protein [Chromatiales bacterium]|nr:YecA family protein [Chromatiales bacterium]
MNDADNALQRLDAALGQVETEMRAVECHGTLVGLLCARGKVDKREWLDYIAHHLDPADLLAREALETFGALFEAASAQLGDSNLEFQPLLPEDDVTVEERVAALAQWAQGFVLGMSVGGIVDIDKMPRDSAEIMHDLVDICRADSYELEGGEEDEVAYNELLEYVRTGVLLINEELHPTRAAPREDVTLH